MAKLIAGITILVTLIAIFVASRFSLKYYNILPQEQRLFTVEQLALYNGTDDTLPILLGILGSVFDVSRGKSHYGVGGSYNHFAGRDASRAFVSGNFTGDGLIDSLHGLSSTEVKSVIEWRDFYFRSYTYCGKLVGRYYDSQGNPTKFLKGVEAKAARGAQLLEKQKNEEAKQPSCNSRWSQAQGGEETYLKKNGTLDLKDLPEVLLFTRICDQNFWLIMYFPAYFSRVPADCAHQISFPLIVARH